MDRARVPPCQRSLSTPLRHSLPRLRTSSGLFRRCAEVAGDPDVQHRHRHHKPDPVDDNAKVDEEEIKGVRGGKHSATPIGCILRRPSKKSGTTETTVPYAAIVSTIVSIVLCHLAMVAMPTAAMIDIHE